jgi:hypothetical protein
MKIEEHSLFFDVKDSMRETGVGNDSSNYVNIVYRQCLDLWKQCIYDSQVARRNIPINLSSHFLLSLQNECPRLLNITSK